MKNAFRLYGPIFLFMMCFGGIMGQAYLHTDKPFYVAGEVIWYKLYLPVEFKGKPVAFKVVITDPQGAIIRSYFLKSEGGLAVDGYYHTPYTLTSGNYEFRFFVSEESGQAEREFVHFTVPVFNDLEVLPSNLVSTESGSQNPALESNQLSISVAGDRSTYAAGSQIDISLSIRDAAGAPVDADISVSVVDRGLVQKELAQTLKVADISPGLDAAGLSNTLYHTGRIVGDNQEPLQGNVLGVYSSTEQQMFYTKSDADGNFIMSLSDYAGEKPVQMIGYIFEEHPSIEIQLPSAYTPNPPNGIDGDYDVEAYFNASRKRKKIYQYFKKNEAPIEVEPVVRSVKQLKPNGRFNIKEYEEFKNLAEFFNELINSQLDFPKKRDGTFGARMYNPEGRGNILHFTGDPIFIIDGKITRNADFVAKMSLESIESVDLYYITKSIRDDFGTFGNSAFAIIHTTLPEVSIPEEEESDIFTISGILPSGKFVSVDAESAKASGPVFRPMIYWNPTVSAANGNAKVSFMHSNDASTYEVFVVGQDAEGRIATGSFTYQTTLPR